MNETISLKKQMKQIDKSVSPQEKYENLEQKMGLFVEGGLDLWESLK